MSNRLDKERQERLEPLRLQTAALKIQEMGFDVTVTQNEILFIFKGSIVRFFPYTGWATGKTIKDGRGLEKLLKQLQ
jgi:hypothetical protein